MSDFDYADVYVRKLREFEGLIKFAARRYHVPGVLDKEDLYQEGCLILDKMFRDYDFDPDSIDFTKLFKTELWHGLWHHLHRVKTKKRDFTKTVYETSSDDDESPKFNSWLVDTNPNPEQTYLAKESAQSLLENFLAVLLSRLDEEAKIVLNEISADRSWDEVPEYCRCTKHGDEYWRVPRKKLPYHALADLLGMPLIRFRRALNRVRSAAVQLGDEVGIEGITAIGLNKKASVHHEAS